MKHIPLFGGKIFFSIDTVYKSKGFGDGKEYSQFEILPSVGVSKYHDTGYVHIYFSWLCFYFRISIR